jgi:nucleoside-diphosphate-sugar epimerase
MGGLDRETWSGRRGSWYVSAVRICVTGRDRGLGAALVERLRAPGHEIVDVDEPVAVAAAAVGLRGCEVVVHLSGRVGPDLDLGHALDLAVRGTAHLLLAMRLAGVPRLVHASTAAVYGRAARSPISEDAPLAPDRADAEAARIAEKLAAAFSRGAGARATILRLASLYGETAAGDPMAAWIAAVHTGRPVTLSAGGRSRSAPLHVDDAAAALAAAVERPQEESLRVLNVAGGDAVTDAELCEMVADLSGRPRARIEAEGEPVDLVPDIGRARSLLGFSPRPLGEGLEAMATKARA